MQEPQVQLKKQLSGQMTEFSIPLTLKQMNTCRYQRIPGLTHSTSSSRCSCTGRQNCIVLLHDIVPNEVDSSVIFPISHPIDLCTNALKQTL